ncbi:DUF5801 repeats-in-toxin domain-containing protein [Kiloniella majae]|uniref:DUF5801 repeats-in-toxin domain-containing protein n=1 Tax=Kiloniella majae TaxID=1938558 RepID=UPI000A2775B6|nr:DUF5801 repeats-in-toxin domain-containing protein [Kiloniella majae]
MTDGLTNTGNETVSGEEGKDLLVGQAASALEVTAPAGGETKTISLEKGQTATLSFDATAATPVLEGNDFVLTFDSNGDGSADSRIVFENLVENAQGADAPVLVIGGIELSSNLLIGQAQALAEGETLETAAGAGAGPQGGGGSTYDENLGDIIDLLQAQQGLGGTGLEFELLADGGDITDPAEGVFELSFLTVQTEVPDEGDEENFVSGTFSGGFEDWQPNQHLGDESTFPMQVEFNFTPADNETLDSVVIEALPEGVELYIGGSEAGDLFTGSFPVTINPEDFDAVFIRPPEHSDADITVNATANISDPDSGESASIPATSVAIVDAAADLPTFEDGNNSDDLRSQTESLKDVSIKEEGADREGETGNEGDADNADIRLPVTVTFPDYADDSEVHELVLDGVPTDWSIHEISGAKIWQVDGDVVREVTFVDGEAVLGDPITDTSKWPAALQFAITDVDPSDDEAPFQPLKSEQGGDNFVRYIIDVSEKVDKENDDVDDGGNFDSDNDGSGTLTTNVVFSPNDWTDQRLANGQLHKDGDANISIRAVATEVGNATSGDELTDADGTPVDENNQAVTDTVIVNVSVAEDAPELQPVTLVHDETPGTANDDGKGNVNGGENDEEIDVPSDITDSFNRMFGVPQQPTLASVTEGEQIILPPRSLPEAIGQAVNAIHYDLKTDGANDEENNSDLANDNAATDEQEAIEFDLSSVNLNGMESAGSVVSLQQDPTDPQVVWGVTSNGGIVFALHIDGTLNDGDNTGQITFVQYAQIDHSTDGDGDEGEYDDTFSFELAYKVTDDEGDAASQSVTVTVQDDGPSIQTSSASMDESDALYGTYSLFGADETVTIDVADAGRDSAGFHNTIGYYVSDADGNPIGGKIIQPDAHDLTSTSVTFNKADYPEGATVGIFLIPNGDNQNSGLAAGDDVTFKFEGGKWVAYKGTDALSGSQEPAYFSNSGLNPDGSSHVVNNTYPGNQNWEDLRNPKGDGDYNDVNLIVKVTGADPVDGCGVAVGQMTFDVGTDVVGHSFNVEAPTGVTSATETVTTETSTSADGRFITIEAETTGGDAVYTFVFDTTNGKYEFTQYRQLDHDQDGSTPADHDDLLALGFNVTLTDGDGDTASAVATINIDDDGPSAQADAVYTDETSGRQRNTDEIRFRDLPNDFPDLVDGDPISAAKESLSFDFGKDKIGGKVDLTNADGNAYTGELSGLKDAATDQDIKLFSEDENTVVGRLDSGEIVFVAYMSHSTSSESANVYFVQYRGVEHPNKGSHDEDINLNKLFYTVTDGDGDTATANIRVNIVDDEPIAVADTASAIAYGDDVVEGNVLDNDTQGADGAKVTKVTFEGDEHAVSTSVETVIIGDHGKLTISSDGEFRYEAFQNDDTNLIQNGSFENGHGLGNGRWGTFDSIEGWTKGDGSKFEVQNSSGKLGGLEAEDGTAKVELDGHGSNPNATVQQVVAGTKEGQDYTLTFSYSPRPGDGAADSSSMNVFWNGVQVKEIDSTGLANGWRTITVVVKGTGAADTVLAFKGAGTANTFGAYIDNVSLVASEAGGDDVFTYEITDGDGDKSSSTFSVSVDADNTVDFSDSGEGIQAFLNYDNGPVGGANAPGSRPADGFSGLFGEADGTLDGIDNLVATDHGDYVYGSEADNIVLLGAGNDTFDDRHNGSGNDRVDGGTGNDTMWTGDGEDILIGGTGNDNLSGEAGNDILIGGSGNDRMSGGSGSDTFVFKADTVGDIDTVRDFKASDGDALDLSELLTGFAAGADSDATATVLQDYLSISQDGSTTVITIDQDGSGSDSDVTIRLENNDLTSGGSISEHDAIQSLLDANNLIVE